MSGLIDSLFPPLDALDRALAPALPPWARLVLYGALSGAVTVAVYRLVSNQGAILAQKARMREIQARLKAAGDDFAETMRLSRANLAASMRLLGLSLWPALVSGLPVIVMIAWLAMRWAQPMPAPGTPVALTHAPPETALTVEPPAALPSPGTLAWPPPDAPVSLKDGTGTVVYEGLGARPPASVIHKPVWWNALLGNPAGYLPESTPLREVRLAVPEREVLGFGPSWARGFELTYFATVVVVSLAIKAAFRIA